MFRLRLQGSTQRRLGSGHPCELGDSRWSNHGGQDWPGFICGVDFRACVSSWGWEQCVIHIKLHSQPPTHTPNNVCEFRKDAFWYTWGQVLFCVDKCWEVQTSKRLIITFQTYGWVVVAGGHSLLTKTLFAYLAGSSRMCLWALQEDITAFQWENKQTNKTPWVQVEFSDFSLDAFIFQG